MGAWWCNPEARFPQPAAGHRSRQRSHRLCRGDAAPDRGGAGGVGLGSKRSAGLVALVSGPLSGHLALVLVAGPLCWLALAVANASFRKTLRNAGGSWNDETSPRVKTVRRRQCTGRSSQAPTVCDKLDITITRTCVRSAKLRRRTRTRKSLGWTKVGDPIASWHSQLLG